MNSWSRPEVLPQNDAHVNSSKRIGLHHDLAGTKHPSHSSCPVRVAPANDHPRQTFGRIGVAQEDDINAVGTEHSGCRACRSLTLGAVQYLYDEAAADRGNSERMSHRRCGIGVAQKPADRGEQNDDDGG